MGVSEEQVISKLKDDGDFDRLRLKIIRLLKQNENLHNNIASAVKESAVLNCAGAEKKTPRQLCDAIHEEISENMMNQVSDGLWEIIRSEDHMKTEIRETVQSVYDKLLNSDTKTEGELQSSLGERPLRKGTESGGFTKVSGDTSDRQSDGQYKAPPGVSSHNHSRLDDVPSGNQQLGPNDRRQRREPYRSNGSLTLEDGDTSPPPGFIDFKRKRTSDGSDEDPDIPPGFG